MQQTSTTSWLGRPVLLLALAVIAAPISGGPWSDLLDCSWDPEWSAFREHLQANAAEGFPLDQDLALRALELSERYQEDLLVNPEAAYGASRGMLLFFNQCNLPPGAQEARFCLYGAIAAFWVVARSGHPAREGLLGHAQFLLGSTMRNTLDFMESSGWPISSADVLANLQQPGQPFRLPQELQEYMQVAPPVAPLPPPPRSEVHRATDAPVRIVVWEIGVHASLSAEPLQMWARFVPRAELRHRNLVQDQYPMWMPDRCRMLYNHPRLTCDTHEDELTALFRRRMPQSATSKEPIEAIDDFAQEFAALARPHLGSVDAFLCTVAYLCLLVERLSFPVLGYFGHPLLFMVPREQDVREAFWPRFASMLRQRSVGFAVSDPFLQMQYEYQLGAPRVQVIRTHALYTGATHVPVRADEVLVMDRPHECILMCTIQRLLPRNTHSSPSGAEADDWPTTDGRLRAASSPDYRFRFLTRSLTDRAFSTFAQFRAVVLWPYDMDLITFYEFYSMNMPIFMPNHLPKYIFHQDHMDYNGTWSQRRTGPGLQQLWPEDSGLSPFNETSLDAVRLTVGFSDYFRFPHVQHFFSIPELLERLLSTDFFEVIQSMAQFNQDSLVQSANSWRALLRSVTGWDAELLEL